MPETISLRQIHDDIKTIEKKMITKEVLNRFIETIEIMHNPETVRQIVKSKEDIKKGRVKKVSSVRDLLREM